MLTLARALALACALLSTAALAEEASTDSKPLVQGKIAVLDLNAVNAPAELAATLTETIAAEAATVPGVSVIGKSDIKALLSFEMQKSLLGCGDDSCLAEIGGALGVDTLISGSLGKVGEVWVLNLKMMDAKNAKSLGRREQQVEGGEAQLLAVARNLTSLLMTGKEKQTIGFLDLVSSASGARVIVDGKEAGVVPVGKPIPLEAGVHKVIVRKDGYVPWESTVNIKPAQTQGLEVTLVGMAEVVASSSIMPWVWVSLGVAVAAGGGGVFFGRRADANFTDYEKANTVKLANQFKAETEDNALIANVFFAGAAVFGLAASTLFVIDLSVERTGGGGSIAVGGSF